MLHFVAFVLQVCCNATKLILFYHFLLSGDIKRAAGKAALVVIYIQLAFLSIISEISTLFSLHNAAAVLNAF